MHELCPCCGACLRGSDHCPLCGCEQYEARCTVGKSLRLISQCENLVDFVNTALAELNSFADGPRLDLEAAISLLFRELRDRREYWSVPFEYDPSPVGLRTRT